VLRNIFCESIGSADNFFPALIAVNLTFLAFLPAAEFSYDYFEKRFSA
jgi:hypothetical protein